MNQKEINLMQKYVRNTKSADHLRQMAFRKINNFSEEFIPMKRKAPSTTENKTEDPAPQGRAKKKRKLNFNRKSTVTIAFPGSILEQRKKNILRENLVTQIARSVSIFKVDEVVVYNEYAEPVPSQHFVSEPQTRRFGCFEDNVQTANILYYLDCPPYLRKLVFPILPELGYSGSYPPLISPNHTNSGKYREGVYTGNNEIYLGDDRKLVLDETQKLLGDLETDLVPKKKYTVEILGEKGGNFQGRVVDKLHPRMKEGKYFGYKVRVADSLSHVWSDCPFESGYDVTIGTSVNGGNVDNFSMPGFKHLLIVFGSPKNGLTKAVEFDKERLRFQNENQLFNFMLNVCPDQGTKTIRTEEAVTIAMSALRPYIQTNRSPGKPKRPFVPLKE